MELHTETAAVGTDARMRLQRCLLSRAEGAGPTRFAIFMTPGESESQHCDQGATAALAPSPAKGLRACGGLGNRSRHQHDVRGASRF